MQQLLRTAASLSGEKMPLPTLMRLPPPGPALSAPEAAKLDAAGRVEINRLRALVRAGIEALARRLDGRLPEAIDNARRAWETADDVMLVDHATQIMLADTRRTLYRAAAGAHLAAVRAVALECVLAFDAACGLAGLAERKLSSLIRLRVRSAEPELLPEGRPFLDLGRALAEAAQEWA